jgi:hypothetical protein
MEKTRRSFLFAPIRHQSKADRHDFVAIAGVCRGGNFLCAVQRREKNHPFRELRELQGACIISNAAVVGSRSNVGVAGADGDGKLERDGPCPGGWERFIQETIAFVRFSGKLFDKAQNEI